MFCTYAHTKPDGTIFYIGKGSHTRAHSKKSRNKHWNNIVNKYGSFGVDILANWNTEKEAFDHEILLISCFRDMGYTLANISEGGLGSKGFKHTEDYKKNKQKLMLLNNPMSNPEFRKKQQINVKAAMQRLEVREKQSKNRIGIKFSESHIENLKKSHIGICARGESSSAKKIKFENQIFDCIMDLADYVGVKHKTMYTRLSRNPERWGYEVLV
jgi:hypothetical protein